MAGEGRIFSIHFVPGGLRALREEKGLSQNQLIAKTGFHKTTIQAHEKGEKGCRRNNYVRFAEVLGWKEMRGIVVQDSLEVVKRLEEEHGKGQQSEQEEKEHKVFPDTLPPEPKLIGRDNQLKAVKERLFAEDKQNRLALHGIPGVGKTALALKLVYDREVREYFDGILWAGLGRGGDALAQLGGWAGKLGISPEALKGLTTVEKRGKEIRAVIGDRRVLLVVDDIWTDDAAAAFSIGGPNCVHVITARAPEVAFYFADEEGIIPVHPLPEEDGLALLGKLAPRTVKTEPEMARELRELVKAVGGLPLALKLMGNYLKKEGRSSDRDRIRLALNRLQSPEERLRLKEAQKPLEWHSSLPEEVYISLWVVIQISVEALDEEAREALYALSVFPSTASSFSGEAAWAVTAAPAEVIYKLVDVGLLETNEQGRYFLHQTIADYGRVKRTDEAVYERMVSYFVNYIGEHERDYGDLDRELDNILVALDNASAQGKQAAFVKGANTFFHFLDVRGLYELAERLVGQAKQAAEFLVDPVGLSVSLHNLGIVIDKRWGDYTRAEEYFQEALGLAHEAEDQKRISALLQNLGKLEEHRGNYRQAEEYFEKGLAVARETGDSEATSGLLQSLGLMASLNQGNYEKAERYYQAGLEEARRGRDHVRISAICLNLGGLSVNRGNYALAEKCYEEGLAEAREVGHRENISALLMNFGSLEFNRGNLGQATRYYEEGLAEARAIRNRERIISCLANLGAIVGHGKNFEQAEKYLLEGLAEARDIGHREAIGNLLRNLGEIAAESGNYESSVKYYEKGLSEARDIDHPWLTSSILCQFGEVNIELKRLDVAEKYIHEALEISQGKNIPEFIAIAHHGMARIAAAKGDMAEARRQGQEAMADYEKIKHGRGVAGVRAWLDGLPT